MNENMTYEQAKKRLEEISVKLGNSDVELDEAIDLYEEAAKLTAFCYEKLSRAELRFSEISLTPSEE